MNQPLQTQLEHQIWRHEFNLPVRFILMHPLTYNQLIEELIATGNLHLINLIDEMHTFKGRDIYRSLDCKEGVFKLA